MNILDASVNGGSTINPIDACHYRVLKVFCRLTILLKLRLCRPAGHPQMSDDRTHREDDFPLSGTQ